MINIGQYIETAINWLTEHFASFFDALSMGIGGFIDGFQHVLFGIPFYITIAGIVCIKSRTGRIILLQRSLLAVQIPNGTPKSNARQVEESTNANVCIVSSQKPMP